MKVMHGPFFCSSVFASVCVFNGWPKTTLLLPVWPRDAKSLDTPASIAGFHAWLLNDELTAS